MSLPSLLSHAELDRITARIEAGAYVKRQELRRYALAMRQYRYERRQLARLAIPVNNHPRAGFSNPREVMDAQTTAKAILDGTY